MPGITIQSGSQSRSRYAQSFRAFAEWNHRDGAELFVDQTRKLATELYTQTAAIAPTKGEIAAKVHSLGWRVTKRGTPDQWTRHAVPKRGRGRPGTLAARAREAVLTGKATLEMMQAFVIKKRSAAIKYLASGWLGAMADLGGSLRISSGKVDHARGGAEITRAPGRVEITLWNRTPGIETMDAKKRFVEKAFAVRSLDMSVYIHRKMDEAARRFFRAA